MASKENQGALNNLVYFADPFDQDEFNRVERWKNTLQQAIDRNELLEKALEIATSDDDVNDFYREDLGIYCMACLEECNKEKRQKCIINKCLELARNEIESEKEKCIMK